MSGRCPSRCLLMIPVPLLPTIDAGGEGRWDPKSMLFINALV